jgi:hypothetical protein
MAADRALTRTTRAGADWPFWLVLSVLVITTLATLRWGATLLGWLETPFGWFGLLRSPTSHVPNGSIGALCFAWLALVLLVLACLNLRAVLDNQPGQVLPAPPRFLAHWLSLAQRSPLAAAIIGWAIGLLPMAAGVVISTTFFT